MKYFVVLMLCIFFIEGRKLIHDTKSVATRILGGQAASAGQFPSAAGIYIIAASGTYFCGGSLISNQWVITAGHCLVGGIIFQVNLGSTSLSEDDPNRVTLSTSQCVIHPQFNAETSENDIGLIRFNLPVTLTEYISPIRLPRFQTNNVIATAIGWGETSDEAAGVTNALQYVQVATVSNTECQRSYDSTIFDTMICVAGNYNEGPCRGDAGSALMISFNRHHWLIGVASFISTNGCESIDPSGYTRTYSYMRWIKNVTKIP